MTKTGTPKRTRFGLELEASAKQILAHLQGKRKFPTRRVVLPDEVDVKRIRGKAGMSQAEFARAFCINPRTLQEWEQGRRKPDTTTRAYLAVIAKNRDAVLDALAPPDRESRLRLFDQVTERHRGRGPARSEPPRSRGWTREDLYPRGRSR